MRLVKMMVIALLLLGMASPALSGTPLGGLTVTIAPKGDLLAAAGDNRVLYVLDAAKLEVKQRVWLKTCILNLEFNKDGTQLLAEDTDGTILLVDTSKWQIQKELKNAGLMSAARNVDLVAGLDPNYNGHVIRFLSMTDLSEKGRVTFEKGQRVVAFGLNPEGKRLAVMMESVKDEGEPTAKEVPKDLKGLAADEFRLKNDGKTSLFMVFEVPSGKKLAERKLFYSLSSSGWKTLFQGEKVLLVNYSNVNALVGPDGAVTLFQLDNSYNYGLGGSVDQKILSSGGLADGTYTLVDGLAKTKFQIDRLPGWPEYFKGFAIHTDGTSYGGTSSYRIIKIKKGGTVEASIPIY